MGFARYLPVLWITSLCLAADPMAETAALDRELEALDKSPPALEMERYDREMNAITERAAKDRFSVIKAAEKLRETDAWKDYVAKRQALETKREGAWEKERAEMVRAAKELYATRHDELRQRAAGDLPAAKALGFDVLNYPRVDGSTSTHPLSIVIASRVLNVPYQWLYPEPQGYQIRPAPEFPDLHLQFERGARLDRPDPSESHELSLAASRIIAKPSLADARQHRVAMMINSLLTPSSGTHGSYETLIRGTSDLVLAARLPSPDELKFAAERGLKLQSRPIARDALVFVVHKDSPIKSMTLEEIRTLYKDVFSRTEPKNEGTRPLMRERNSGSRELFDALVMKDEALPEPKRPWQFEYFSNSMGGPYARVTRDVNALGYSVYYYERYMAMSPFSRTIAIDGVEPNAETIASGKYPLASPVYAVLRENEPTDSPARKLLEWLLSDEGQAVVRESGYVPLK